MWVFEAIGESHKTGLALTQFFLTQPFPRYSISNPTSGPLT